MNVSLPWAILRFKSSWIPVASPDKAVDAFASSLLCYIHHVYMELIKVHRIIWFNAFPSTGTV